LQHIPFAGITRRLMQPKQARQWGLMEIPAFPNKPPDDEELGKLNMTEALPARMRKELGIHQVMEVVRTGPKYRRLREGVMLVFQSDNNLADVAVAFFIDGRPASEIDLAFINAGGIGKLRLVEQLAKSREETDAQFKAAGFDSLLEQADASETQLQNKLERTLQKIGEIAAETKQAEEKLADDRTPVETTKLKKRIEELEREQARLEQEINTVSVRHLRVQEHRPLFEKCLETASKQLLIISPWIVDQVLTETRLQKIAALVQRGVRVSIGYGISEDATVNDPDRKGKNAIKRLESLQRAYPQTFCFRRLGNTHEKILIKDSDLAVVGSFNWLSFEGRDGDKIRYESSLMVTHREKVDDLMMEFRKRFPS
jgi:hypothetical protein